MNVIRFDVEISFVPTPTEWVCRRFRKYPFLHWLVGRTPTSNEKPIITSAREQFQTNGGNLANYQSLISGEWENLGLEIKSLFLSEHVVARFTIQNIKCFVFVGSNVNTVDRITLVGIAIFENENIDHSMSVIFNEIERQLPLCKVSPNFENFLYLYPYSNEDGDILDANCRIKIKFQKRPMTAEEWARAIIIFLIFAIFVILYKSGKYPEMTMEVFIAIYVACGFFLLTEIFLKIFVPKFLRRNRFEVSIDNLSRISESLPSQPFADASSRQGLNNPPHIR